MPGRKLIVEILGDARSFERALRKSSAEAAKFNRQVTGAKFGEKTTKDVKGLKDSVGFATAGLVGASGLVAALKTASEAASNLNEQTSKSNVVFGESAKVVQDFSKNALGLAADQALETASAMGQLFRPMGFAEDASARLSVQLTKLGVDLASFSNTSVDEALTAIRAALVGEFEPARRFGVVLSAARVEQEALIETGKSNVKLLTDQEKVQARVNLIMRDTVQAQGDFARTSGSLANQQKTLNANLRNLAATIGGPVNTQLNDWIGLINDAADAWDRLKSKLPFGGGGGGGGGSAQQGGFQGLVGDAGPSNTDKLFKSLKTITTGSLPAIIKLGLDASLERGIFEPAGKRAGRQFGDAFGKEFQKKFVSAFSLELQPIDTAGAQGIVDFFKKTIRQPGVNTPFLDFQQANAEATKQLRDDLAVIRRRIAVLQGRLARAGTLKAKTDIQNQINAQRSAEQSILRTLQQQNEARKEARKEAAKEAAEARREAARKAKEARERERERIRERSDALKQAIDTARQEIGTLFQGPVVAPTDFQRKAALGVLPPGAGGLLADIRAQTAQAIRFERDLKKLRGLGVGASTIDELRGLGTAALPQIEAILRAPKGQQRQLVQALAAREAAARRIGNVVLQAQTVQIDKIVVPVRVDIDGKKVAEVVTTQQQKRGKAMPQARSGRNAGQ